MTTRRFSVACPTSRSSAWSSTAPCGPRVPRSTLPVICDRSQNRADGDRPGGEVSSSQIAAAWMDGGHVDPCGRPSRSTRSQKPRRHWRLSTALDGSRRTWQNGVKLAALRAVYQDLDGINVHGVRRPAHDAFDHAAVDDLPLHGSLQVPDRSAANSPRTRSGNDEGFKALGDARAVSTRVSKTSSPAEAGSPETMPTTRIPTVEQQALTSTDSEDKASSLALPVDRHDHIRHCAAGATTYQQDERHCRTGGPCPRPRDRGPARLTPMAATALRKWRTARSGPRLTFSSFARRVHVGIMARRVARIAPVHSPMIVTWVFALHDYTGRTS